MQRKILTDLVERFVDKLRRQDDGEDLWLCAANKTNHNICKAVWGRVWAEERDFWEGEQVPADNIRQDIPEGETRPSGFARIIDLIKRRDGVDLTSELPTNMSLQKAYKHLRGAREWAPRHWAERMPVSDEFALARMIDMWASDDRRQLIIQSRGYPEAWIVTGVTSFHLVFKGRENSVFNEPIGAWDTSSVLTMSNAFSDNEDFNQYIGRWNVSNVSDMWNMFSGASSFNQPLELWDTSGCRNMSGMFSHAESFNQPIGNWKTQNVYTMASMFQRARAFNQPIEQWDVSQLLYTSRMFKNAFHFNQPLNGWHPTFKKVIDISFMFDRANHFNQPLNQWDTSTVLNARGVFRGALNFVQDITGWSTESMNPESKVSFARYSQGIKRELERQEYRAKLRSASAGTSSIVDQVFAFHKLVFH